MKSEKHFIDFDKLPESSEQLNFNFIQRNKVLLLKKNEKECIAAYCKELDFSTEMFLRKSCKNLSFVKIDEKDFRSCVNYIFNFESESDLNDVNNSDNENAIDRIEENAPAINVLNGTILDAINRKVSDIHLESNDKKGFIRFRVAGDLFLYKELNIDLFNSVSARIKFLSDLNIIEKRLPQDGRLQVALSEKNIFLRVSIIPASKGESIVLRILNKDSTVPLIKDLGFSFRQLKLIEKLTEYPDGLILISGPTGSGKTTTLNSILNRLADGKKKIISIEDPVEYSIAGISQIQVNEEIGLSFESILRRVLRQDPDIIMVGEIRDKTTAELCIRAALTGHLVFSTVHTNDAVGIVKRLLNFGIEPYMISAVLRGIISQRLVKINSSTEANINERTVISETFLMDKKCEEIINNDFSESELKEYLKQKSFEFIKEDALNKSKKGLLSIKNIKRQIQLEA